MEDEGSAAAECRNRQQLDDWPLPETSAAWSSPRSGAVAAGAEAATAIDEFRRSSSRRPGAVQTPRKAVRARTMGTEVAQTGPRTEGR